MNSNNNNNNNNNNTNKHIDILKAKLEYCDKEVRDCEYRLQRAIEKRVICKRDLNIAIEQEEYNDRKR